MELTRNQYLLIVVVSVIILKIIFAEIYFKKGFMPVGGTYNRVSHIEQLKKDLFLSELKMLEKRIERDILFRELRRLIGKKELTGFLKEKELISLLSDDGMRDLLYLYLEQGFDLSEEGLLRFFASLEENEALLQQSKRQVSELISSDGSLPFLNTLDQEREPRTPLYVSSSTISGGASILTLLDQPTFSVVEYRGADPSTTTSGLIVTFFKEAVKTVFDIMRIILYNKELFLILGLFFSFIVGMVVVYSMHFR